MAPLATHVERAGFASGMVGWAAGGEFELLDRLVTAVLNDATR